MNVRFPLAPLILSIILWIYAPLTLNAHEYNLVVGTIFKDNKPYFKEWLEFHLMVGVDHFYLYDNGSTDNPYEVLAPYIEQGIVTLIDWPNQDYGPLKSTYTWVKNTQETAYNHCGNLVLGKAKWMAAIDTDEFLVPIGYANLSLFLDKHDDKPGIFVWWRVYGTSNVYDIPPGKLMIELLTKRFKNNDDRNKQGKVIIKPEEFVRFNWAGHQCEYKNDAKAYISNADEIRINHYVNRTIKFFKEQKLSLKQAMDGDGFEKTYYLNLTRGNIVKDRIMNRFIPRLRQRMGFTEEENSISDSLLQHVPVLDNTP